MTDTDLTTLMAWMRAAIRAHRPTELDALDFDELRGVFHATPKARVGFQEWLNRMDFKASPDVEVEPELTEEQMQEKNEAAIAAWQKLAIENPEMATVKVEPKKDA